MLESLAAYDRQFTSILWTMRNYIRGNITFHEELAGLIDSHASGGHNDKESAPTSLSPSVVMAEFDRVSQERKRVPGNEESLGKRAKGNTDTNGKRNESIQHLFSSTAINKLGSREKEALDSLCASEAGVLGRVSSFIKSLKESKRTVRLRLPIYNASTGPC